MSDCEHLRIVFAGTPEFAVPPLQVLAQSSHSVVAVYTQPDRPAGRGRKLAFSAVKQRALDLQITCCQPASLRTSAAWDDLAAFEPDLMVVVAYGQILPEQILSIPRLGCLNIHGSLLPRWRGAAPIHRAILAGDVSTGVSIMQMEAGLDTGPVLLTREVSIDKHTTTGELHDTLSELGASCLLEAIVGWCQGSITPQIQQNELASYANKIEKSEARIDWQQAAEQIHRQVRALNPWPVAETSLIGKKLRIWQAEFTPQETHAEPGTVVLCHQSSLQVACGSGSLMLTEIQLPGKKAISAREFINGNDISGVVLGSEAA